MEDAREIASLSLECEDIRYVDAGQDFKAHTRPYRSTIFATLHLRADGTEITHTNKLPSEFDLIDTIRAQQELIEAVETTGNYEGFPFCCVCSNRGCSAVHWTVTKQETDHLSIVMEDLGDQRIGQSPYIIATNQLYEGLYDFWTAVLEFCSVRDIQTFEWAHREDPPISGRDYYATTSELETWKTTLRGLIDA
jgi:hypothetical protein